MFSSSDWSTTDEIHSTLVQTRFWNLTFILFINELVSEVKCNTYRCISRKHRSSNIRDDLCTEETQIYFKFPNRLFSWTRLILLSAVNLSSHKFKFSASKKGFVTRQWYFPKTPSIFKIASNLDASLLKATASIVPD